DSAGVLPRHVQRLDQPVRDQDEVGGAEVDRAGAEYERRRGRPTSRARTQPPGANGAGLIGGEPGASATGLFRSSEAQSEQSGVTGRAPYPVADAPGSPLADTDMAKANRPAAFDVWFQAADTVYRGVPYGVVTGWAEQGRLAAADKLRPAGTEDPWV